LAKDEIYYQFLNPKINLIGEGEGSYVQEKLFDFKNSFLEKISLVIREPESSLMGGIILGAKSSLDKDLTESFKRVGLIHIVALSGYNITVVADSLMRVTWFLPLASRLLAGSIVIVLFGLMTGGGSTVVRASIMVLLAMLARATGRIYLVGSALIVAATVMILYDPKIFVFDISFQLSFLATAGLIFFTPILEKKLEFTTERFGLRGALVSTLSAQLAVWPFILYKMGNFSLVSIPVNLLIGPVIPATMFFGFLTGSVGFISYHLSLFFSYISYIFLYYIIRITEIFSSLPLASLDNIHFPLWMTVMVYVAYLVAIYSWTQPITMDSRGKIDSKRMG
jgi:competence protein ComEC